ncbi:MAG TPA: ABC transporter permease subunit [Nocardioides sp.]|uniref:ABC transporter permease subunit n=1 Tax=Nocardioides sp. TaxID=35761 RepID=UPI002F3FD80B
MNALSRTVRAELFRLRRWPAFWVTVTAWLLLNAMFGYVFNFVTYTSGDNSFSNEGQTRADVLATIVPSGVANTLPQGMPLFGGAIMMVLGAIVAGNGYGWGTWKTVFTQGPSRVTTMLGSMWAVVVLVAGLVVVTLVSDTLLALGVAGLESQPVTWSHPGDLLQSFGGGLLVMEMWALAGYFLGTLARSPAVSVGLGLVWALVIEGLLRGVGTSLQAVAVFTHFLPGTAAGSLIGSIVGAGGPDATPGLLDTLPAVRAVVTVAAWAVVLPVASLWLVRRRDVA